MPIAEVRICRCCYFARVEKGRAEVEENYQKLKAELGAKPCLPAPEEGRS